MDIIRPGEEDTTPRLATVDSGADISIVREEVAQELGFPIFRHELAARALGGQVRFREYILVPWCIARNSETQYSTRFYILLDDPDVDFDFLLGKDWMSNSDVYPRNPAVRLARRLHF